MQTTHRFSLEKYRTPASRHTCPACGQRKVFTRYVDLESKISFPDHVGKCSREINCGYHCPPRQHFKEADIRFDREAFTQKGAMIRPRMASPFLSKTVSKNQPTEPSFIPNDAFLNSLKIEDYARNQFFRLLFSKFGEEAAFGLVADYFLGNSSHYNGANVFWQMDAECRIRTGKIIQYDSNGHRVHGRQNWVHSILKLPDFHLSQCFFGEHLLATSPGKTVAIVESEKTAVLAAGYFDRLGFVWLACGGLTMLQPERCHALQGRQIVLFPDTGLPVNSDGKTPFQKWTAVAETLNQNGFRVTVSDLLEQRATLTEKQQGTDLADYLLRFSPTDFIN